MMTQRSSISGRLPLSSDAAALMVGTLLAHPQTPPSTSLVGFERDADVAVAVAVASTVAAEIEGFLAEAGSSFSDALSVVAGERGLLAAAAAVVPEATCLGGVRSLKSDGAFFLAAAPSPPAQATSTPSFLADDDGGGNPPNMSSRLSTSFPRVWTAGVVGARVTLHS